MRKVISLVDYKRNERPEVVVVPEQAFWRMELGLQKPDRTSVRLYLRKYLEDTCDQLFLVGGFPQTIYESPSMEKLVRDGWERSQVSEKVMVSYFQIQDGKAQEINIYTDRLPYDSSGMVGYYGGGFRGTGALIRHPGPGIWTRHTAAFPPESIDLFFRGSRQLMTCALLLQKEDWTRKGLETAIASYIRAVYQVKDPHITFPGRPKRSRIIRELKREQQERVTPSAAHYIIMGRASVNEDIHAAIRERYPRFLKEVTPQPGEMRVVYDGRADGKVLLHISEGIFSCQYVEVVSFAPVAQRKKVLSRLQRIIQSCVRNADPLPHFGLTIQEEAISHS